MQNRRNLAGRTNWQSQQKQRLPRQTCRASCVPKLTGGIFALAERGSKAAAGGFGETKLQPQPQPRALKRFELYPDLGQDASEDQSAIEPSRGYKRQAHSQQAAATKKRCMPRLASESQNNMVLQVPATANLLGYLGRVQGELRAVVALREPLIPCEHFLDEPKRSGGKAGELQDTDAKRAFQMLEDQDNNVEHEFQLCSARSEELQRKPGNKLQDVVQHPSGHAKGRVQPSLSKTARGGRVPGLGRAPVLFSPASTGTDAEPCDVLSRKSFAPARSQSVRRRHPFWKDSGNEETFASCQPLGIQGEMSQRLAIEDMHGTGVARRQGASEVSSHKGSICKHRGPHSSLLVSGGGSPRAAKAKNWDFTSDLTFL